ncbi:Peptidase_S8 domain-containing protein [Trichoderma simmonsii]|uniref:Peptidase_S8 domain-containing protein n=1 Tax=Trichoderma simmonsii TaxID=1491479 RepID=A0A8G0LPW9_9HYPO|nr:Peptidase_S8 domain-containing protein [Trichoderma simmonsii]
MLFTMTKDVGCFTSLWICLLNAISALRRDRQSCDSTLNGEIIPSPEADGLDMNDEATDDAINEVIPSPEADGLDVDGEALDDASGEVVLSSAADGLNMDTEASGSGMGDVQPDHQEGQNSPSDPDQATLLRRTITEFLRSDIQFVGALFGNLSDGNVSEESQERMTHFAEHIEMMLEEGGYTQPQDVLETLKEFENLIRSVLQTEIGALSESELLTTVEVESRLHAGELLTQRIQMCLQAMFTALTLQLSCCNKKHFMRLKLTGFLNPIDHKMRPFFDLFLSSGHDCTRSYWAESKCTFIRELTQREENGCTFIKNSLLGKKKLSLLLKETYNQDLETYNTSAMERTQDSLRPIQLDLSGESNSLVTPIVSLASLIKQDEFSSSYHTQSISNANTFFPKDRDWLCLNLALSLLHMSGHDWNRAIWYSDNPRADTGIFFLRDPSTQEIVDKTHPYMSWRLQDESEVQNPTGEPRYVTQLLSFARLLIEIHTWKRLDLTPKPRTEKQLRSSLLSYIDVNFRLNDYEFISALKACLDRTSYIEAATRGEPRGIQAYVLEKIVKPLHRYLGNPELSNSISMEMPSSNEASLDGSHQSENALSMYDSCYDGRPREESSFEKEFWTSMDKFTETYISPLSTLSGTWPREKIRIAIIDSGVREEDAEIAAAEETQRIRGYRNFTSSNLNDYEDQIGHGTMVARLLLNVAPEAELFIAKVTDQKIIPKNQLHRIAEAIKWAVLEWDVDIISISLALSEEHYDINEEITEALSPSSQDAKRKLVFAAAGNWGLYKKRAFPARKEGVIAVHASDGSGEGAKFNPNPESKLNFSTLGQNIKMRWPDPDNPGEMKDTYISGSSFATPIVAGIAANVLEFARHRLQLNDWKKDVIYSHPGMTKVLKAMSRRRGEYDFVHPLAFWEEVIRGCVWEGRRLRPKNQENICFVLESIIESS